ncbi:hypothetical protein [Nocardia lasii]|uniref:YbaB/EbfC family DNA-binding protein n=1 Tax=Nocardia lasii TaxID=1616107 RepID=A0ABW1JMR8_9NOCA
MGDIDPLSDNVIDLQNSLGTPTATHSGSDLVRLEVGPDGTIHDVQLSAAARTLPPDSLVAEIVRVHTLAVNEAQEAISAAIAMLEADPRLSALTERKTDALNQALPTEFPTARASSVPAPQPPRSAATRSTPSTAALPTPDSAPRFDHQPASATPPHPQPRTRSRQPTREEEEDMDRYYNRKSWLEH